MHLVGQTRLSTLELDHEIQFEIVRERGWEDSLVWIFGGLVAAWFLFKGYMFIGTLALAADVVSLIATRVHGPITRLRMRSDELIATGNLSRMFTNEVRIPMSKVKSIGWKPVGEDGPTGLCVSHGWTSTCVLPGIDRNQAQGVVDVIARRFPDIPIDSASGFSLFGDDGKIITLGLSGSGSREKGNNG